MQKTNLMGLIMDKSPSEIQRTPKDIFIFDFDGTISTIDVCDEIMNRFSSIDWRSIGEKYDSGHISHAELTRAFVSSIKATPDEIRVFLKTIEIRKGFNGLLNTCVRIGVTPVIVSSGWDFYINEILSADLSLTFPQEVEEILSAKRMEMTVVCNLIELNNGEWHVKSNWPNTSPCSYPDKRAIAEFYRKNGTERILFAGDGSSDFEIAKDADMTFATDKLTDFCKSQEIRHFPFDSFEEVEAQINTMTS